MPVHFKGVLQGEVQRYLPCAGEVRAIEFLGSSSGEIVRRRRFYCGEHPQSGHWVVGVASEYFFGEGELIEIFPVGSMVEAQRVAVFINDLRILVPSLERFGIGRWCYGETRWVWGEFCDVRFGERGSYAYVGERNIIGVDDDLVLYFFTTHDDIVNRHWDFH